MIDLSTDSIKNSDKIGFILFAYLKAVCLMDYPRGCFAPPKSKDITVLIPCYGKADTIERAVKSAVNQTLRPFQVIVLLMDDKSKAHKTQLEILGETVNCVETERMNVCAARNKLVDLCKTEYFVFLDADDELESHFLEVAYKSEGSVVFAPCLFSDEEAKKVFKKFDFESKDRNAFVDNSFTCLFHKAAFRELGGFNEKFKFGAEDTDLIIRLLIQGKYKISYATDTYYVYYESAGGLTKSVDFYKSCFLALNEHFLFFKSEHEKKKYGINQSVSRFLESNGDCVSEEQLHSFFNEINGKEIDEMEGGEFAGKTSRFLYKNIKPRQKASFVLDLRCDRKCPYCFQRKEAESGGRLTEERMYENFDKALTRCENLLGYKPYVQLLGGEPTLWSDDLVKRIQKRLKNYPAYLVFSNGHNKESLFWKDPKARINYHITNWENCRTLEPMPENIDAKIIVTKKNIGLVEKFLKANQETKIHVAFSHDAGEEFDLELDDIKRLAEIEFECRDFLPLTQRKNLNFYEMYRRNGLKYCQESCKRCSPIWIFQCYDNTVMTCYSRKGDIYPLEEFNGQETSDCKDCFFF